MEWLDKLLLSPERRHAKKVEEDRRTGITGNYKRRYNFSITQKHWIKPGYYTEHNISGKFDCGLIHSKKDGSKNWDFEMRDLSFGWNKNAFPENYLMFALPWRLSPAIDGDGTLQSGSTWVDYKDAWEKCYKKEALAHTDDEERTLNLFYAIRDLDSSQVLNLAQSNLLIQALCSTTFLNCRLNQGAETENSENPLLHFSTELSKPDYFSTGIPLPLKTAWIKYPEGGIPNDENQEIWVRLGGLDEEKYQYEKFRDIMRQITDTFNLEVPVYADYSELYHMDRIHDDLRLMRYANLYTRTLIKDTWAKEDFAEITMDEKGVIYG